MENYKVDKRSKLLFWLFLAITIASVYLTYERTIIDKDFYILEEQPEQI